MIGDQFELRTGRQRERRWRYQEHPDGSFASAPGHELAKMLAAALAREDELRAKIQGLCPKCKETMNSV